MRARVNGIEIVLKAMNRRSNITLFPHVHGLNWVFDIVYIMDNQMKLFQKDVAYFHATYLKNNDLQCYLNGVCVCAYALGTSACSAAELMLNTRREMILLSLFIWERFQICLHRPDALVKTLTKTFISVKPYPPSVACMCQWIGSVLFR